VEDAGDLGIIGSNISQQRGGSFVHHLGRTARPEGDEK